MMALHWLFRMYNSYVMGGPLWDENLKIWFLSFGDLWQKMTQQQGKEQLVDRLEGVSFSLSLSRAFWETSPWHCIVWLLLFHGTITTSVQKLTHGNHNYKFQEMWMSVKFLSVSWVRFVLDAKAQIATFSSHRKREEQLDRVFQEEVFCSFFRLDKKGSFVCLWKHQDKNPKTKTAIKPRLESILLPFVSYKKEYPFSHVWCDSIIYRNEES